MKKLLLLFTLFIIGTSAWAQSHVIKGRVMDGAMEGEPLAGTGVALLNPKDSSVVAGVATGMEGRWRMTTRKEGTYLLRYTYMGYVAQYHTITIKKDQETMDLGTVTMNEDVKLMREAIVSAAAAQVEVRADTFVYNADAYRVPEGSNIEALIKKFPGAEIQDDGTIKINGKTVKKIMVEGKEFLNGDTQTAVKNLPANMVKNVKAYDQQSDYARITGIDDGEEETVLDFTVKKGMKEGWIVNLDLGAGTEERYTAKGNVMRFMDNYQLAVIGGRNNVSDRGFGGWRGAGDGIRTTTEGAVNFNWENGKKEREAGALEIGGNVRYRGSETDQQTRTNSQTFLTESASNFTNSMAASLRNAHNVDAGFKLEWSPDSMTNINFRPTYSFSRNDAFSKSQSVTFNSDPYAAGMTDPLKEYANWNDENDIRVNANDRISESEGHSNSGGARLQINRRLQKAGRNVTLNLAGNYSKSYSDAASLSLVKYYQSGLTNDNTYQTTTSPGKNYHYQGRLSYTEPLAKYLNLQVSYQAQRRFQDQNRTMLTWQDMTNYLENHGLTHYTAEQLYTGVVPGLDKDQMIKDLQNSQYATYKELNHDARVMLRYNKKVGEESSIRVNAGVSFQPQTTHMDYQKSNVDTTIVRHTYNWAPSLAVRWKISKTSQLNMRYFGSMNQPSMTNLLEVMDTSDPLHISTGNAGLKSSWSDRFYLFYNNYLEDTQTTYGIHLNATNTRRSISNATIYDQQTGVRYSRPLNIDGNWNIHPHLIFNTAIGKKKYFNISSFTAMDYSHSVGYQSGDISEEGRYYLTSGPDGTVDMDGLFAHTVISKQLTKQTYVRENLRLNYRRDLGINQDWNIDFGLQGSFGYNHARNNVQAKANLDTWTFEYGGNAQVITPWNMTFSTDIAKESRRGYDDKAMNTNELIWNLQLSQGLKKWLKGQDLTVSLEWYDVLKQRSNISRSISATMRSDSYNNAINSYFMVHLIYKLNLVGNKQARKENGPGMGGPGMGGPGGPGGGHGHERGSAPMHPARIM